MGGFGALLAHADGDLNKVKHIIIVMQENHSFDNYFGVLPYAVSTPYKQGPCDPDDHACVDGLSCERHPTSGAYRCRNFNRDNDGSQVFAFHSRDYCVQTDLNHEWVGTHREINYADPNAGLRLSPNDGFVLVNDASNQPDDEVERRTDDETMSFYNEKDIGFYYDLAKTFALSDRHFSSVLGPTFPNRAYAMAATSFGHLTTSETVPDMRTAPLVVYHPLTGTIFDLLDSYGVPWAYYFSDAPHAVSFRNFLADPQHFRLVNKPAPQEYQQFPDVYFALNNLVNSFMEDAAAGTLPAVVFVDAASGNLPSVPENDEHPGSDIRAGQAFVAQIVKAVRTSRNWKDSILFITHDEHGGFYDHVPPPAAPQGGARTPDGIGPGQCADASNPPASEELGGGVNCKESQEIAAQLCPAFRLPTEPFPPDCASFDQLGLRVPLLAVSPFAKPQYVSHRVTDHTAFLALIERRFLQDDKGQTPHLTARDAHAETLEDLFDFDSRPSLHARVHSSLAVPASPSDPGCSPPPGEML